MSVFSAETVESLAMQVEKRLEVIDAFEFIFRVKSNTMESPEMKETRHEYAFFRSKDPNYPRPWERWKVFYEKKPGVWELDKFVVFDGKTIWTWDRVVPPYPDNPEGFNMWSKGVIRATVAPDTYMGGDEFHAANEFPHCLFMGVVGYGKSDIDKFFKRDFGLDKWQIVESTSPSEYVLQRIVQLPHWQSGYYIRAYLRLEPVPVVWRTESSGDFLDKSRKNDFTEIESFTTFDDVYYPAKGRSVSYAKNIPHDTIYEFEVESVKQLTEADKAKWVLDWPTGTQVSDMAFGKNLEIQHTKEQLLERQEEYYAKLLVDRNIKTQSKRNWIVLSINVIGILLIFFLLYRKYKTKK